MAHVGELKERYEAAMVLGGVGDALGYKNGQWEHQKDGLKIHRELESFGSVDDIIVKLPDWKVSDDTVMHLATAKALTDFKKGNELDNLYHMLAQEYVDCMSDMKGRGLGDMCMNSVAIIKSTNNYRVPFSENAGGCGAAMRSMCIGLAFPAPEDIGMLIEISIESGRMTHHHPTGYLGSFASALFTSYAIQGKPVEQWGAGMIKELHHAKHYISNSKYEPDANVAAWNFFKERWEEYLYIRRIESGSGKPYFPRNFDVKRRDEFYRYLSYDGWGGSSGHDAPMIAYDAILGCNGDWKELCSRAMFHGGDSDSTGIIAGCLFGAKYGFSGPDGNQRVKPRNYKNLEYVDRLKDSASKLFKFAHERKNKKACTSIF